MTTPTSSAASLTARELDRQGLEQLPYRLKRLGSCDGIIDYALYLNDVYAGEVSILDWRSVCSLYIEGE